MDLKFLMEKGIDVGEVYTKLSEISRLSSEATDLDQEIFEKEKEVRVYLKEISDEAGGEFTVDLMNGTMLVVDEDVMYIKVKDDD